MARGYLGKISAIVTVNTSSVKPSLDASAKDINDWARKTTARISGASGSAERALNGIFTPLQRLQAAIKNANRNPLDLKIQNPGSYLQLAKATEQIAKPLGQVQSQFASLANNVQAELLPVLQSAQKQTTNLFNAISSGAKVSDRDLENTASRVERLTQAIKRASEASQLTRGLATGQELRFQQPAFVAQTRRSAELQQQAAALTPAQFASSDFAGLISQQRQAAIEAERLLATLDRIRTTRNGDAAAAQRAYDQQIASLEAINTQLSEQIRLARATVAEGQGQSSDRDPTGRTIQERVRAIQSLAEAEGTLRAQQSARLELANQLLTVDQRESQLLSSTGQASDRDPTGRTIQERVRAIQSLAEAEGTLRAQQEARLEAANRLLRVDQQESAVLSNQGAATQIRPGYLEQGFQRQMRGELGPRLDDSARQIGGLQGSISALKGQLDALPLPIRTHFLPAITAAENEFIRLRRLGPQATADDIENVAAQMRTLEAAATRASRAFNFRRSLGGGGLQDLNLNLQERSLAGYAAQLQVLQGALGRVSSDARGPAVASFLALQNAIANAFEQGTLDSQQARTEIERLTREAVAATAQVANVSRGALARQVSRAGDVGRGGFDRFSLALNQAAFAIDDFFSSTGGLEFKLRAISNNITQLAFVLGGTTGLFVGLAAVIGGQAAVAITKWVNGGRTAEDQTRALNEALARQKSLVEDLRQAFESLGDSIASKAFSPAAREASDFREQLDSIAKKQKELRDESAASSDPTVQRERATQGALQRRLDSETDIGRRIAIQRQLEESRRREREAAAAASGRNVGRADVARVIAQSIGDVAVAQLPAAVDPTSAGRRAQEEARIRRQAAAEARRQTAGDVESQRAAVQAEINRLAPIATNGDALGFGTSSAAARAIAQLQQVLASLTNSARKALDELAISVLEGAEKTAQSLERAQQSIAAADFGQSGIAKEADATAKRLKEIADQITPEADQATIEALKDEQNALRLKAAALESAASSVERFAAVIDRVARQLSDTVLQEVESRGTQARRASNAAEGALNAPILSGNRAQVQQQRELTARQAREDRDRAEADVRRATDAQRTFERQRRGAVRQFERDAAAGNLGAEAQDLIRQRDEAQAVLDSETATIEQQQAAAEALQEINGRLNALFEDSVVGRALAALADQLDRAAQSTAELQRQIDAQRESSRRGRELTLTPAQAAAEDLERQIADIRQYASDAAENSSGLPEDIKKIRDRMNAAIERATDAAVRSRAPAVFALRDNVANALLQGPSRSALNAQDASTVEGARELNRLLRGDDPARDVNLLELQKQTKLLEDIKNKEPLPVA